MLVENEEVFVEALRSDLRKPKQESYMSEIDMLKNDVIGILRHIKEWTKTQYVLTFYPKCHHPFKN